MKLQDFDELLASGLVKAKHYPEKGLVVLKYARKVFYDNLWLKHPLLVEARGIVFDTETGDVVIHPFTKVFNYGENNTFCDPDQQVLAVRKVNGFMAAARFYKDELLVSTTGTLDSDYADMARKHIVKLDTEHMLHRFTYIFEICDKADPHIVDEAEGAYLIGARSMSSGGMVSEHMLDVIAYAIGAHRPKYHSLKFGELCHRVREVGHEGFMVLTEDSTKTLMKIKSPHYLTKKFLMRMGDRKIEIMANQPEEFKRTVDEEYYPLVDFITASYRQSWKDMNDQERRVVIEDFLNGQEG